VGAVLLAILAMVVMAALAAGTMAPLALVAEQVAVTVNQ